MKAQKRTHKTDPRLAFSFDSLIAVAPLVVWSAFVQGTRVLSLLAASVAAAVIADLVISLASREKYPLLDLTAVVTGASVVLFFPVTAEVWSVAAGSAVAVFALRIINMYSPVRIPPVLFGAAAAQFIFGRTGFIPYGDKAGFSFSRYAGAAVSEVPEITQIKADGLPDAGIPSLLFGGRAGLIGDTAIILLVIAFIWLCARKHRRAGAPIVFLAGTFALFYAFPKVAIESDIISLQHAAGIILCAPYLMTAVFVTGDPAVLPHSPTGRLVSGAAAAGFSFLASAYVSVWYAPFIGALAAALLARPLDLVFGGQNAFGGKYVPKEPDGVEAKENGPADEGEAAEVSPEDPDGSENIVEERDDSAGGDDDARGDEKSPDVEALSVLNEVD
jgi:Na+-translocating ferredoxin:NAD+ oxidoreductase RnfD subunit